MYDLIGKLIPKKIRLFYKRLLTYAGVETQVDKFIGFNLFIGLSVGYIIASGLHLFKVLPLLPAYAISFIAVETAFYVWLSLTANSKASFVDEILPDALQLMSSNIRAGLTTDKALLMAARPEFGPLTEEIKRIGKESMAGKNIADSLKKTSERIQSTNLEHAIELITQSIRSGGQLADLLDQTANDLRDQQMIQKEVRASVLMYVIFIFFAIGLGAPLLFAMSGFLVNLLTTNMLMISSQLPSGTELAGGAMPISMSSISVKPEFIHTYSVISLIASSFFGCMIMGLILKGEEREGFKYLPILAILSIGLYYLGSYLLETVLGGIMVM